MKLRRIFAAIAACAVAATMAISAFAAEEHPVVAATFVNKTGKDATLADSGDARQNDYKGDNTRIMFNVADFIPEGVKITDVYGFQLNVSIEGDVSKGYGGSFILSSKGKNWQGKDWKNNDTSTNVKDGDNKIIRTEEEAYFTDVDVSGADGEYAQIILDAWWGVGVTITVNSIDLLDKEGKVLTAPAAAGTGSSSTTSTTGSSSTANNSTSNPKTGATAGLALAGLAIAGAAVVAAKKSK